MSERESSNHHDRPAPREYTPPSARDVAIMAKAYHWPPCQFRGTTIAGAPEWEAALTSADPDEREALREALPGDDE
jgi:hypothetical protein